MENPSLQFGKLNDATFTLYPAKARERAFCTYALTFLVLLFIAIAAKYKTDQKIE